MTDQDRPAWTGTDQDSEDFNLVDLIIELAFLFVFFKVKFYASNHLKCHYSNCRQIDGKNGEKNLS